MRLQTQLIELRDQFHTIPEWYEALQAIAALENKEIMKKHSLYACSKQAYIAKKILILIKNKGMMRIKELRDFFPGVTIDSILITLNTYDFLTLFTGEVSNDEYYKGIYLDPESNPRTWVKVAE